MNVAVFLFHLRLEKANKGITLMVLALVALTLWQAFSGLSLFSDRCTDRLGIAFCSLLLAIMLENSASC